MPVTSCYARGFADSKNLPDFLRNCQKRCQETKDSLMVSVTQSLSLVEPLAILQHFTSVDERHFYWENQQKNCAIVAWDSCEEKLITGNNRFQKVQNFIDIYRDKIVEFGEKGLPEIGLKFFTTFTFFESSGLSSPFPKATVFIPKWQITRYQDSCFLTCNFALWEKADLVAIQEEINRQILQIENVAKCLINLPFSYADFQQIKKNNLQQQKQFKKAVMAALEDIQSKQITKIVLSHYLDVTSPFPLIPCSSLNYLREKYRGCYIFSVGNKQGTSFIGATPERLFSLRKKQLVSDALAGSAPRGKSVIADQKIAKTLLESEKEKREHQAVSNYIIKQLEQLGLTPTSSPRKLLKLSNIQHLWTVIQAEMSSAINPLEIVAQLHPTPAVAGVPSAIACEKIQQYETFDRALYAAPIGWLDTQGNAEFMVGIRSAMINKNQARLYAGAGIVAGSNPEKELAEVKLKLQTMLKALR